MLLQSWNHICVKVSGGPSDAPAVLSSEMTDKKPEMILYVKKGKTAAVKPAPAKDAASKAKDAKAEKEKLAYKDKVEKELTAKFTAEVITKNKAEAAATIAKIQ